MSLAHIIGAVGQQAPSAFGVTDDFNRANESPISTPWTVWTGTPRILSNQYDVQAVDGGARCVARYDGAASVTDMYAQLSVIARPTAPASIGPTVRCNTASWASGNGYAFFWINGLSGFTLFKFVAGSEAVIDTVVMAEPSLPYTLRIEAQGTTLRGFVNGSQVISTTDTDISTGTGAAIFGNVVGCKADTFAAGDL